MGAMKLSSSSIRRITLCLATAATALTLSACDSKKDNAAEKKADAIESQKSMSNDHSTNAALENKADAVRNNTEQKADAMENKADAVRDQTATPTP